jgi:hypothetical protein
VRDLLLLRAEASDELPILSACVQDMAVLAGDVGWQPRARRLAILGNRFRWEAVARGGKPTRVLSALRFDHVVRVQRRGWPGDGAAVLALLAMTVPDDGAVELHFGGGVSLRLVVEAVDVTLEDLSGAWGAASTPLHEG